jgi:hypothetical protein
MDPAAATMNQIATTTGVDQMVAITAVDQLTPRTVMDLAAATMIQIATGTSNPLSSPTISFNTTTSEMTTIPPVVTPSTTTAPVNAPATTAPADAPATVALADSHTVAPIDALSVDSLATLVPPIVGSGTGEKNWDYAAKP